MNIKIERAWQGNLDDYKDSLASFNPTYDYDEHGKFFAMIEINDVSELFSLAMQLDKDLVITHYKDNTIFIYDGFIE